jgi:predicted anti-sigma-YlaC factor YlaD
MDCREIRESLLDSLEGTLSPLEKSQLDRHLAECPECSQFAVLQRQLDIRLHDEIAAPQLSPGFRAGLLARIARQGREPWPDWLPDVAHLAGSGVAIGLCTLLLPLPVPVVLGTGVLVAFLTYSLQTLLISALERQIE